MRWACTTNYEALYGQGYYAHGGGAASFHVERAPQIIATEARLLGSAVLDIGGGSGLLARRLAEEGVNAFTVDAAQRQAPLYKQIDLSHFDPTTAEATMRAVAQHLGDRWLTTCLDVAEHIDREDLADFLLTLSTFTQTRGIISISTRPSSQGNRFHCSVLPIDTWKLLLQLAGFKTMPCEDLDTLRPAHRFSGADLAIAAVSHWQRRNPFRDRESHQHYLTIEREHRIENSDAFRATVNDVLDVTYRSAKRQQAQGSRPFPIIYNVHFIQDWSFARSLLDVCATNDVRILFRRDTIAEPLLGLLENMCLRLGIQHQTIATVAEGAETLDRWPLERSSCFVTATEGAPSLAHSLNSLLVLEARRRGLQSIVLQHGVNVRREFAPASASAGAWDHAAERTLARHWVDDDVVARALGSPKCMDALYPCSAHALAARFGNWTSTFRRCVLVGLNLHWHVHMHSAHDTAEWLERLADRNRNTLFLIRPHPDDVTLYTANNLVARENVLVVDEMTLLSMDLSVARLLREVDGVLTTSSSLIVDAAAAGRPIALVPSEQPWTSPGPQFLPVSTPIRGALHVLTDDEWRAGVLPAGLMSSEAPDIDNSWFGPSREFVRNFFGSLQSQTEMTLAERRVAKMIASTAASLQLDQPSSHSRIMADAIRAYVS